MALDFSSLGSDIASSIDSLFSGVADEGFTPPTSEDIWNKVADELTLHIQNNIEFEYELNDPSVSTSITLTSLVDAASVVYATVAGPGSGQVDDATGKSISSSLSSASLGSDISSAISALFSGVADEGFTPPTPADIWQEAANLIIPHIIDNLSVTVMLNSPAVSTSSSDLAGVGISLAGVAVPLSGGASNGTGAVAPPTGKSTDVS